MKKLYIGLDFDGTIVEHAYPKIGATVPGAIEVIHALQDAGHNLILHTMRSGPQLAEAVAFLKEQGIELFGINENRTQKHWTTSPKTYCHVYIDDAALGCPMIYPSAPAGARPWVDWIKVHELLISQGIL